MTYILTEVLAIETSEVFLVVKKQIVKKYIFANHV